MKRSISVSTSCILAVLLIFSLTACSAQPQSSVQTIQQPATNIIDDVEETEEPKEFNYTDVYMESVDSTCFSEIGYDGDFEILLVRFLKSGSLYEYYDVPEDVYEDLLYSDSPGGYYNYYIKGQYECDRLE